jgi:hypothetical protein
VLARFSAVKRIYATITIQCNRAKRVGGIDSEDIGHAGIIQKEIKNPSGFITQRDFNCTKPNEAVTTPN